MKFIIAVICTVLIGCGPVQFKVADDSCINKADYPDSIILKTLDNPCNIQRAVVTIAKGTILLDQYTYKQVVETLDKWDAYLGAIDSISAGSVKDVLIQRIVKLDKRIGITVLVVSDTFLAFDDNAVFESDDITVMRLAIADVKAKCAALAVLM